MAKVFCLDCHSRVFGSKYFMVKNELWEKYGVGKKFLCINCFENRLVRKLNKSDFGNKSFNLISKYFKKRKE